MNCPIGRPKNRQAYKINRAFRKMGYEIKRCMKRGQYLVFCWAPVLAATIELEYEIPAFMFNTSITSDMRNHNRSAVPASCIAKKNHHRNPVKHYRLQTLCRDQSYFQLTSIDGR